MIVYWASGNFKILVLCIWQFLRFFHLSPLFFIASFLSKRVYFKNIEKSSLLSLKDGKICSTYSTPGWCVEPDLSWDKKNLRIEILMCKQRWHTYFGHRTIHAMPYLYKTMAVC